VRLFRAISIVFISFRGGPFWRLAPSRIAPAILLTGSLGACGIFVPQKSPFSDDETIPPGALSRQGKVESNIIANIRCEIRNGAYRALGLKTVPWLETWGATVTLKLIWDEMGSLSPGLSVLSPLPNAEAFTLGVGVSGSAHATRVETITFNLSIAELLSDRRKIVSSGVLPTCDVFQNGIMIQSDLRIDQFIYDKASITPAGEATTRDVTDPQFTVFQEQITFVASYGANATPTWKLTRLAVNPSGTFASASRTLTGDVLITLGPLAKDSGGKRQLASPAREQHNAAFGGGATATSIQSQTR
jgi:hypothetical protein